MMYVAGYDFSYMLVHFDMDGVTVGDFVIILLFHTSAQPSGCNFTALFCTSVDVKEFRLIAIVQDAPLLFSFSFILEDILVRHGSPIVLYVHIIRCFGQTDEKEVEVRVKLTIFISSVSI